MILVLVVFLVYLFLLTGLALEGHTYKPRPSFHKRQQPIHDDLGFTIIINYRNEHNHLPQLFTDLINQTHPRELIQIILVNDHSTDRSNDLAAGFQQNHPALNIQLLDRKTRSNSAKKDGITQAIQVASHERILCTDADCRLPGSWIASYNAFYKKYGSSHFVAGPVVMKMGKYWLHLLQQQEMISLQIVTAGSFHLRKAFMCNGANMSFTRTAFAQADGYTGNNHIASGDDVFLLEKMLELDVERCHYIKDAAACVTTIPKSSWMDMVLQRARWAGKGKQTRSLLNKLLAFSVLITSLAFYMVPFLYAFEMLALDILLLSFTVKFLTDAVVLVLAERAFETRLKWLWFPLLWIVYPAVVLHTAICSMTPQKIQWHDRATHPQDQARE